MSTASPHHVDVGVGVGVGEIAELLVWCRRLSVAGPDADPTERAAYLATKHELLTRITDPDPRPTGHGHDREEQR